MPRIHRHVVALVLFFLAQFPGPVLAQRKPRPPKERADIAAFRARLEATLSVAAADKGHWAVLVTDAATGETLYSLNPQKLFTPASNTKLFTTALALAALGPDYRFRTAIEARGTLDRLGRLGGDVVLVGRGDANLSNRKFPYEREVVRDGPPEKALAALADAVVAGGVRQIEGDIVADDSWYSDERYPSGWLVDDTTWNYGAPVSAIVVNDNVVFLELRPGDRPGAPAWFGVEPWADYYTIRNEVSTGAPGSERKLELIREPGSRFVVVRGSLPADAQPVTLTLAVEDPAEHAALLLKRLLEARGVRVYGQVRTRHSSASRLREAPPPQGDQATSLSSTPPTVLAEHSSLPLAEDIRLVNKISQNLHAELLLRAAARERVGALNYDAALDYAAQFFKSIGIPDGDLVLHDGSGLSRRNLTTPRAAVALLQYAAKQPWGELYLSTLPVAGEDGTLTDRMKNTAAAGRIRAKTGTLDHTNALAGHATTLYGRKLIFSIFGNNHDLRGRDATGVIDAICVAMVEEIGRPPKARRKR